MITIDLETERVNTETLLEEMVEIDLRGTTPENTRAFSGVKLDHTTVRWGCMRILEWLRTQSVALRMRPSELEMTSDVDVACIKLVEAADSLREIIEIKDGQLVFSPNVSLEQAQKMMLWAKENYCPPIEI